MVMSGLRTTLCSSCFSATTVNPFSIADCFSKSQAAIRTSFLSRPVRDIGCPASLKGSPRSLPAKPGKPITDAVGNSRYSRQDTAKTTATTKFITRCFKPVNAQKVAKAGRSGDKARNVRWAERLLTKLQQRQKKRKRERPRRGEAAYGERIFTSGCRGHHGRRDLRDRHVRGRHRRRDRHGRRHRRSQSNGRHRRRA